ncbi:MAG: glycosyltransferase family 9 protein [Syntrophobacteraceae bacterium]|nr:glycosyltransferase family 9 protein [Syntrophobacteraceae bacterium]
MSDQRMQSSTSGSRVLVFQIGSIGDTVVSIPALKAVRRHFGPQSRIVVLHDLNPRITVTPRDILAGSSLVDDFIGYPFYSGFVGRLATFLRLVRRIRKLSFDAAVCLTPSNRPASSLVRDSFIFRLFGIRKLVGFRALCPMRARLAVKRPDFGKHEALLRLERIETDGVDVSLEKDLSKPFLNLPEAAVAEAEAWLSGNRSRTETEMVAIFPGCKQPANSWPIERFVEIGRRLASLGKFELVVGGGPADRDAGDFMVKAWGEGINAAGKLSVLGSAALIARCRFLIGLDTGTTHLAGAMGVPCVAIFGGRNPDGQWYPLGTGHTILISDVQCARCGLPVCPLPDHPCMTGTSVERVWEAVAGIAGRERAAG